MMIILFIILYLIGSYLSILLFFNIRYNLYYKYDETLNEYYNPYLKLFIFLISWIGVVSYITILIIGKSEIKLYLKKSHKIMINQLLTIR